MSHLTQDNKNVAPGEGKPMNSLIPPQEESTGDFRPSLGESGTGEDPFLQGCRKLSVPRTGLFFREGTCHVRIRTGLSVAKPTTKAQPALVPPQEEKGDFPPSGGSRTMLEKGMDFIQDQMAKNPRSLTRDDDGFPDPSRDKSISDAVRAGAAGVTGEDFGIDEGRRIL
ncbi:hypothetical protein BXZ70DRAFT_241931 [Cristinia sonorae]|uniref:Uncharacterized protein n=1 Tax=Cristinia sonorae TaxID=1940300 RepID=A0A8K0UMJ7_9AGAR|nr:hypothetical protein BXZ70DRAFT_241931 [Cristinia sonorae]